MNPGKEWKRTHGERIFRHLCKWMTPFTPHRSRFGRMLRSRCKIRPALTPWLLSETDRTAQALQAFDPKTQILVLGTSHVQCGIKPEAAQSLKLWNLGFSSCDYRMEYYLYDWIRTRWEPSPGQCVVLGEDFWQPALQSEYSMTYYVSVLLHTLIGMPYRSRFGMWPHERLIRHILTLPSHEPVKRGYLPIESALTPDVIKRAHDHLRFARYAQTEIDWAKRLCELIARDGRRIVLFRPPLGESYRAELERQVTVTGLDIWRGTLTERADYPTFDYSAVCQESTYWRDADHLNDKGATAFTRMLERDMLRVLG